MDEPRQAKTNAENQADWRERTRERMGADEFAAKQAEAMRRSRAKWKLEDSPETAARKRALTQARKKKLRDRRKEERRQRELERDAQQGDADQQPDIDAQPATKPQVDTEPEPEPEALAQKKRVLARLVICPFITFYLVKCSFLV